VNYAGMPHSILSRKRTVTDSTEVFVCNGTNRL